MTFFTGVCGAYMGLGFLKAHLGRGHVIVAMLKFTVVAACIAISWLLVDGPLTPRASRGRRHVLLAIIKFVAWTSAALQLTTAVQCGPPETSFATLTFVNGFIMSTLLVAMTPSHASMTLSTNFGAIERMFCVVSFTWLANIVFSMEVVLY